MGDAAFESLFGAYYRYKFDELDNFPMIWERINEPAQYPSEYRKFWARAGENLKAWWVFPKEENYNFIGFSYKLAHSVNIYDIGEADMTDDGNVFQFDLYNNNGRRIIGYKENHGNISEAVQSIFNFPVGARFKISITKLC